MSALGPAINSLTEALETERLVRECLIRFHRKPALIVGADGAAICSGRLLARIPHLEAFAPRLDLEFSLRGLTFTFAIPNSDLMRIAATWNQRHYTVILSHRFRLEVEDRSPC